jgi:hypothetical protein
MQLCFFDQTSIIDPMWKELIPVFGADAGRAAAGACCSSLSHSLWSLKDTLRLQVLCTPTSLEFAPLLLYTHTECNMERQSNLRQTVCRRRHET